MHRRAVLVPTRQPELAQRFKALFVGMDVVARVVALPLPAALQECAGDEFDLIIVDGSRENLEALAKAEEALSGDYAPALLIVVPAASLERLRLPVRLPHDFIVEDATDAELQLRIRRLLWPGEEAASADFVRVGSLTLNLATYQVKVDGATLDLTYLEYALLAFLITHPGRTYSRDALLRRVWGFEYYGGSRTVDVHVRRVRAKLGPELAGHLETVRGVGYLWTG
ncbi:MAG: response regulator transcription factor [Coriobacteriales bacterium]|jgi:DNA-binding response OmpR family regulator|nr:response regulator transcription factor [Coriobacteriales bacterium]